MQTEWVLPQKRGHCTIHALASSWLPEWRPILGARMLLFQWATQNPKKSERRRHMPKLGCAKAAILSLFPSIHFVVLIMAMIIKRVVLYFGSPQKSEWVCVFVFLFFLGSASVLVFLSTKVCNHFPSSPSSQSPSVCVFGPKLQEFKHGFLFCCLY